VSFINNGGNLAKTLRDVGSSDNLKSLLTTMVTAGAMNQLGDFAAFGDKKLSAITLADGPLPNLGKNLITQVSSATLNTVLTGASLEDGLKSALLNGVITTGSAFGANYIGDLADTNGSNPPVLNSAGQAVAHALLGCVTGQLSVGDCGSGAAGGVVGELAATWFNPTGDKTKRDETLKFVGLVSGMAGAITKGDGSASSVNIAVQTGVNAAENNRLLHPSERQLAQDLARRSGGKYTAAQIEEQMRLMGNRASGISPNTVEVLIGEGAISNALTLDPALPKVNDAKAVVEVAGRYDAAIQQFIVESTKDGSNYIPGVSAYVPSKPNSTSSTAAATALPLPTAACANLDITCKSGVGVAQNAPLTPEQRKAAGDYFGQVSTDYQRAANVAVATGQPELVVAFEIAAGVAALLEQSFNPSAGKVVWDAMLIDSIAKKFADRAGLPMFLVQEVVEREIKPKFQSSRDYIDKVLP
jgi:hypothetical protein